LNAVLSQDFQKDQVNKDLKKRVNDGDDRGLRKISKKRLN
jgi:hypothetical protein